MKWLGIHGAAGSGKDTVADYIIKTFGGEKIALADPMKHFCRTILGFNEVQLWGPSANRNKPDPRYDGPLRAASGHIARVKLTEHAPHWLLEVLPHFTNEQRIKAATDLTAWLEDVLSQRDITPRYALQTLGTEWGRAQDQDIWLKYADLDAQRRELSGYAIIPDCRFLNEGAFLHAKGAPLLELVRPGVEGDDAMAAGVAAHPSEMERVRFKNEFRKFITHTLINDTTLDELYSKISTALKEGPRVTEEGVQST